MQSLSKTEFAKKAIHVAIAGTISLRAKHYFEEHTDLNPDGPVVTVGSMVAGEVVARNADRMTDPIVDRIVTKWQTRKESKKLAENLPTS
jgi:hypothetical protein